jgi:hypothetical protein
MFFGHFHSVAIAYPAPSNLAKFLSTDPEPIQQGTAHNNYIPPLTAFSHASNANAIPFPR